jgi:hypothetical protein
MTSRELELIDDVCEMILVAKFGLDYLYKKDENGDLVLTNAAQDYYIAINEDKRTIHLWKKDNDRRITNGRGLKQVGPHQHHGLAGR